MQQRKRLVQRVEKIQINAERGQKRENAETSTSDKEITMQRSNICKIRGRGESEEAITTEVLISDEIRQGTHEPQGHL